MSDLMPRVPATGPKNARVVIVGEAPGKEEVARSIPFVGASGTELTNMLHEAGFIRADCFITNCSKYRPIGNEIERYLNPKKYKVPPPPLGVDNIFLFRGKMVAWPLMQGLKELEEEIKDVNPDLIISLGNTPLWALTGETGIMSWRGSLLNTDRLKRPDGTPYRVLATYHPAAVLRRWEWRHISVYDMKRGRKFLEGSYTSTQRNFIIQPDYPQVMALLGDLLLNVEKGPIRLVVDIETIPSLQIIDCIGLAWSKQDALCIPFRDVRSPDLSYFTPEEEVEIIWRLRSLLTHKNTQVIGHNFLYDDQYMARNWGFTCNVVMDTMIAHHVCFPGMEKSLNFCASLYCYNYTYWKEERQNKKMTWQEQEANWVYNCKDVTYNFEVAEALALTLQHFDLLEPFKMQMALYEPVLSMMFQGVRADMTKRASLAEELMNRIYDHEMWIYELLDEPLNPRSPKQMQKLFYQDFGLKPVLNRKTRRPTTDEDALHTLAKREPLLSPLINRINEIRSLNSLLASLTGGKKKRAVLDADKRIRCSYNICGTETFRFASSIDVFGFGFNLQNVTSGDESKDAAFHKPNMRKLFIPDEGYLFFDIDLDRADAQVVAWDSGDELLQQMFLEGVDIHDENAKDIFGTLTPKNRALAKAGVHATNYFCQPRTLASTLGITVHEAEYFQMRWFQAHPAIAEWHKRIRHQLMTTKTVRNTFGYRRRYFDRVEHLLPEALAWIPQSTVAIVINQGIVNARRDIPLSQAQVLLQVHDSAAGQMYKPRAAEIALKLKQCFSIPIPYPKPLTIPVGLKTSSISWGDCKSVEWNNPVND